MENNRGVTTLENAGGSDFIYLYKNKGGIWLINGLRTKHSGSR